ncbi:MAG: DUF4149 domain-containing protein [Terriglobales bacterium]
MQVLRFLMLLSLVVWIGGIIFFAFVVAPTVFTVLPTHDLAGKVVNRCLGALHWIGIISGLVYLITSLVYSRMATGFARPLAARHILIVLMIILTMISLWGVTAKMNALRADMGVIDNVPQTDARHVEFNQLHQWSTRLEIGVFLMGLVTLFLTGKALSS